jgi:multiple sugar transport system ATP-binding protein
MKDGYIQQLADPVTVYDKPVNKFVAGFIGTPPMNFINGRIIKKDDKFYFDEGKFQVKVADEMMPALESYVGKPVTFGVRSEDIYDKLFVTEAPPENTITASVEVIEPMGSEVYLYLTTGLHSFIAKVAGHAKPIINQDMELLFDMSMVHFFDKDTEKTII